MKKIFYLLCMLSLAFNNCSTAQIDARSGIKGINKVQPSKAQKGGYVVMSKLSGEMDYIKLDSALQEQGFITGAENGLNVVSNKAQLGGALIKNTTIDGANNAYSLTFDKLNRLRVYTGTGGTQTSFFDMPSNTLNPILLNQFSTAESVRYGSLRVRADGFSQLTQNGRTTSSGIIMNDTASVRIFQGTKDFSVTTTGHYVTGLGTKTSETNIVYYDPTTSKIVYGAAPSGGGSADNLGNHTATQDINASNFKVTNLATPTASTDAANKAYVDALTFKTYHAGSGFYVTATGTSGAVTVTSSATGDYTVTIPAGVDLRRVTFNGNNTQDAKVLSSVPTVDVTFVGLGAGNSAYTGGATGGDGDYNALPTIHAWDFNAPVVFGALNAASSAGYENAAVVHKLIGNATSGTMTFRSQGMQENFKITYNF